jgi:hypothetical protein
VFAGKAIITIMSQITQNHYTFKITKAKDNNLFFVSVLHGSTYTYVGIIKNNNFSITAKSTFTNNTTVVKAFSYFFNHLKNKKIPDHLSVYHEGSCGRCGRPLTTPESIEIGLGPICANF